MTESSVAAPLHAYGLTAGIDRSSGVRVLTPIVSIGGHWFRLDRVWPLALGTSTSIKTLHDVIGAEEDERRSVVHWCADQAGQYRNRGGMDAETAGALLVNVDTASLACPLEPLQRDVLCVGLNYLAHVQEGAQPAGRSAEAPDAPVYFTKAASSVIGPNDTIDAHRRRTVKLDYEVELAFVMERDARDLDATNALEHVFGFTVFNDVSARDLQAARKQWYLGKSLEGTSPLGPWIVPRQCVADPQSVILELRVNGHVRQRASTNAMIHSLSAILQDLTAGHRVQAGSVVATGTPEGCGYAMDPPTFLQPGDLIEATIEGLGAQRNRVIG